MREAFLKIKEQEEVRSELIDIKAKLKKEGAEGELRELFKEEPQVLLSCLSHSDAKVRKNAALILGAVGSDSCRDALWEGYQKEGQRFVKASYLKALKGCACETLLPELQERRQELLAEERTQENEKHLTEELGALNELLNLYEEKSGHRFTGFGVPSDVILLTEPNFREVTADQITQGQLTFLRSGMKVLGGNLEELVKIRTYKELLFILNKNQPVHRETVAEELCESGLLKLIEGLHEGEAAYRFRIECKSKMTLEERGSFTRKLSARLEVLTGGKLVNSTSDYELELRLVEGKNGDFLPLLKLYTIPHSRFGYRKNSVAASMKPVQAALLMELARPYLKENARVLDPFCGVGTLLLERNYCVHADTLYGVDFYGPAVMGARENAQIARVPAHFVQKDFRSFTHEYLFDEIVTNMPVKGKNCTAHDLEFLYGKLFERAEELLKPGSMLFLYAHDKAFVKRQLREHKQMELLKEWLISEKENSWFFAIRWNG